MKRFCMRPAVIWALMASSLSWAADDYSLRSLNLTCRAPTQVQILNGETVHQPAYLDTQGNWQPLAVRQDAAGIAFSVPDDALGKCVIILDRPQWLTLPDADPPVVSALSVGGKAVEPVSGTTDIGHVAGIPTSIVVTVADEANPIAVGRAAALIDDRAPEARGGSFRVSRSKDGRHADITISLGNLARDRHVVEVLVPDAAPTSNTLALRLAFDTSPLLKNGDFEEVAANGTAKHWYADAWSLSSDTEYEFSSAEGAGRTGRALRIIGIAGNLSLLARQEPPLEDGRTYVISGYYRSDATNAGVTLYTLQGGQDIQYEHHLLTPAGDWTPFRWEFTMKPGANRKYLYLRSAGKGTTYYDDVQLELKE